MKFLNCFSVFAHEHSMVSSGLEVQPNAFIIFSGSPISSPKTRCLSIVPHAWEALLASSNAHEFAQGALLIASECIMDYRKCVEQKGSIGRIRWNERWGSNNIRGEPCVAWSRQVDFGVSANAPELHLFLRPVFFLECFCCMILLEGVCIGSCVDVSDCRSA